MADVEFGDLRDGGDWLDIFECEAVAGVRLNTVFGGKCSGIGDAAYISPAGTAAKSRNHASRIARAAAPDSRSW